MFDELRRLAKSLAAHPTGWRRPIRSVVNFVGWQVRSRLSPVPHQMKFINGTHLWVRSGETGVTGNIYRGLHEFEDMAFVVHSLRPDTYESDGRIYRKIAAIDLAQYDSSVIVGNCGLPWRASWHLVNALFFQSASLDLLCNVLTPSFRKPL